MTTIHPVSRHWYRGMGGPADVRYATQISMAATTGMGTYLPFWQFWREPAFRFLWVLQAPWEPAPTLGFRLFLGQQRSKILWNDQSPKKSMTWGLFHVRIGPGKSTHIQLLAGLLLERVMRMELSADRNE